MSLYLGTTPIANDGSHNTANVDLSNLSNTGEAHFANPALTNSPYTTNRILEIPQDIKLELNDGTLTLKAGSKLYYPDGFESDGTTPKFDAVMLNNDVLVNYGVGRSGCIPVYTSKGTVEWSNITLYSSGATQPQGNWWIWYDTNTNNIKFYDGSTIYPNCYLPLGLITENEGSGVGAGVKSIDQVFNGFGYIGSTVFALPGIKVQIPNGRNEDGSFKNRLYTETSVKTFTTNSDWGASVLHGYIGDLTEYGGSQYDFFPATDFVTKLSEKNLYLDTVTGRYNSWCPVVSFSQDSTGRITSFTQYSVDSVVNSNLSNLSAAGQAKFDAKADINFSNLNNTGNAAASNLNSKGIRTVVETYKNGMSWYRIWSDGWIEQGGLATGTPTFTISFLKPFRDANYTLTTTTQTGNGDYTTRTMEPIIGQILASSCTLQSCPSFNGTIFYWKACGY